MILPLACHLVADQIDQSRLAYSVPEVARMLGVSEKTVRRQIDSGELASFMFGGRRLIKQASLKAIMDSEGGG